RYGPMVLAACRRVLQHAQHAQDAEDAFQATFLVLARKPPNLERGQTLAGWLYTIAYRAARDARNSAAARRNREQQAMIRPFTEADDQPARAELRRLLDDELHQLPEKYRTPVILCYLDGQSNEETARQLGWPVGTVKVRLSRARDMLRKRLERRGLALSLILLADLLAEQGKTAPLGSGLVEATVNFANHFAAGAAQISGNPLATSLAEGVLRTMKAQPAMARHRSPRQPGRAANPTPGLQATAGSSSLPGL